MVQQKKQKNNAYIHGICISSRLSSSISISISNSISISISISINGRKERRFFFSADMARLQSMHATGYLRCYSLCARAQCFY